MIATEFSCWWFLVLYFISLSDKVNAFFIEGGGFFRQRRLTLQSSSSSSDSIPTLHFNLTSLLHADNAQRIHLRQLCQDAMEIIEQSSAAENIQMSPDVSQTTNPALDPFRRFLQPYSMDNDIKYHGHFVVPPSSGAPQRTLPPNVAFALDDLLEFLPQHLSTRSTTTTTNGETETVVILSNLHQPLPSSWQQVEYISKVLTVDANAPFVSLLHVGTASEKDESCIPMTLTHDTLQALQSLNLILAPPETTSDCQVLVQTRDVDLLRAICAGSNEDDLVVEALIKLMDLAVTSDKPSLVLMCSSVQSFYVSAAVEQWKDMATSSLKRLRHHSGLTKSQAEELLREKLTIVTTGALSKFPVGPAYIHVYMCDDIVAEGAIQSMFSVLVPQEGTQVDNSVDDKYPHNPVVLKTVSPYPSACPENDSSTSSLYSSDAHNMLVCAIQFLHLILRINGLSSFRTIFEQGSQPTPVLDIAQSQFNINYAGTAKGLLALPQDEILLAVLQAMGVGQWLWNDCNDDMVDEVLPQIDYAKATVEEYFGYDVYEELQAMVEAS